MIHLIAGMIESAVSCVDDLYAQVGAVLTAEMPPREYISFSGADTLVISDVGLGTIVLDHPSQSVCKSSQWRIYSEQSCVSHIARGYLAPYKWCRDSTARSKD